MNFSERFTNFNPPSKIKRRMTTNENSMVGIARKIDELNFLQTSSIISNLNSLKNKLVPVLKSQKISKNTSHFIQNKQKRLALMLFNSLIVRKYSRKP